MIPHLEGSPCSLECREQAFLLPPWKQELTTHLLEFIALLVVADEKILHTL